MRPARTNADGGNPPQATNELVKTLWPVVLGVATKYATDEDEREDLVQECLLRITEKLPTYRRERGSVSAWARIVAENRCRSVKRKDRISAWVALDVCAEIPDDRPTPDDLAARAEATEVLMAAVGRLSSEKQRAVALRHFDGLTYEEAGEEMGMAPAKVRRLVRSGMRLMRGDGALGPWNARSSPPTTVGPKGLAPPSGEVPALALEPNPEARDHVRRGVESGGLDGLLDGVWFASDWSELVRLVDRLEGCPAFLDAQSAAGDDWSADLRELHENFPDCPIIAHGDPEGPWFRGTLVSDMECVAILRRGVDDDPPHVHDAALRAIDHRETESLLSRLLERAPRRMHRILGAAVRDTVEPCSVERLANGAAVSVRTLRRRCCGDGLPAPRRLLALARIYHVERLARWSHHSRVSVAVALGFSGGAHYCHAMRRELGMTTTEIGRRGGPDYVAEVILGVVGSSLAPRSAGQCWPPRAVAHASTQRHPDGAGPSGVSGAPSETHSMIS